ncbi:MAG TPA: pilus assembly protein PilZ [Solidesulfovibrio magneticus]|nr:pilus assembly protein PilZ [Solidesulfovibrio magneticus]
MNDSLAPVIQATLDLHFGRLDPLVSEPRARPELIRAAATLMRRIAENILAVPADSPVETLVQRHVFAKDKALPVWLVNRGLATCDNDRQQLEASVRKLLSHPFNRRRFLDFLSNELLYHRWLWAREDDKRHFPIRCANELRENGYCLELNTFDHVIKLGDNIIAPPGKVDDAVHWRLRSIGTVCLVDLAARPVFDYTARLLEAKYKTTFILDTFKALFAAAARTPGSPERQAALVMGEIPKVFTLADHAKSLGVTGEASSLELLRRLLAAFDRQTSRNCPESRLRLGAEPPQGVANRVAAMIWLRRTLARVKEAQQKKTVPARGHKVAERTMLLAAADQKSILYFNLFADPADTAINPCHIRSVDEESMTVVSPRGNRLNDAAPGQEVSGYFAVVGANKKSTYCDFRSTVESVTCPDESHCLVELSIPATFELTRRNHKRLPVAPSAVVLFEMAAPAPAAEWNLFNSLEKWPRPFCIIPDGLGHCRIKDLSAGGMLLEIHHDAPACPYFTEDSRDHPLLVQVKLAGKPNAAPLWLGIRAEAKRIRDFPPLRKKYVGFQFVEAGEVRNERSVRFAPVGKDGLYLINDWIFRNGLGK